MATTITGKLNKDARQFQAGDSTGFGVRLGVKYRDPKTKKDEWCNYQAAIFAKSPGQIAFYQQSLVEGAVIEVSCDQLAVESYDGQSGQMLSINMLNARLGYVFTGQPQQQGQYQQSQPQQRQPQQQSPKRQPQQQAPQRQPQQQPQQMTEPDFDFDDDIPF